MLAHETMRNTRASRRSRCRVVISRPARRMMRWVRSRRRFPLRCRLARRWSGLGPDGRELGMVRINAAGVVRRFHRRLHDEAAVEASGIDHSESTRYDAIRRRPSTATGQRRLAIRRAAVFVPIGEQLADRLLQRLRNGGGDRSIARDDIDLDAGDGAAGLRQCARRKSDDARRGRVVDRESRRLDRLRWPAAS